MADADRVIAVLRIFALTARFLFHMSSRLRHPSLVPPLIILRISLFLTCQTTSILLPPRETYQGLSESNQTLSTSPLMDIEGFLLEPPDARGLRPALQL